MQKKIYPPVGLHLRPQWVCQGRGRFESIEGKGRTVKNEVMIGAGAKATTKHVRWVCLAQKANQ